jgi:hypothetical protein
MKKAFNKIFLVLIISLSGLNQLYAQNTYNIDISGSKYEIRKEQLDLGG